MYEKMRDLLTGYRITQMIIVAAKFGVADRLVDGPRSVEELAAASGAHCQSLYRVLRALASLGIFRETEARFFELTQMAQTLRSDVPGSLNAAALTYSESWWWDAWGQMAECVRTGDIAFDLMHGEGMFEFMDSHPDAAARFNTHMVVLTDVEAQVIVDAYDFSTIRHVVDVGGGHGALLSAILKAHPHLRGTLFDQPSTVEGAKPRFDHAGLLDRCDVVGGNFFESIPAGADLYILKNIIHDWNDERATTILKNCRCVMSQGSRLILIEHIVPPGNGASIAKTWDMTMLVIVGGAERTEDEYRDLLRGAGLHMTSVTTTASGADMIEAVEE